MELRMSKPGVLYGLSVFSIITVLVILLIIPDFFMYSGTDFGVYFNNGRLLSQGQIPYKDFWDHKTPGIFLYLGFWQLIFGSSWLSAKASLIPIYTLWGIAIFTFSKIVFKQNLLPMVMALSGIYLVLRLGFDPARNGAILVLSTSVELLALSLIFLLIGNNIDSNRNQILLGGLAGLCSSLAILIRQSSLAPFIVMGFLIVANNAKKPEQKKNLNYLSTGFMAGSLALLLIALFLSKAMGLTAATLYKPLIVFNRLYAEHYFSLATIKAWIKIVISDIGFWVLAVAGIWLLLWGNKIYTVAGTDRKGLKFVYICLGTALLLTIITLKPQSYYKIQYLPYLLLIACAIILFPVNFFRKRHSVVSTIILVIPGILLFISLYSIVWSDLSALKNWHATARYYHYQISSFPDQVIARDILSLTNRKNIFIHGNRAWIYLLTESYSPNEYYFDSPMFRDGYLSPEEFGTVLSEFDAAAPEIIVYWSNRPTAFDNQYNSAYVESFEKYVRDHYRISREIAFPQTWPYTSGEPIHILVRAKDPN